MKKDKMLIKEEFMDAVFTAAGLALCTLAYNLFLIPNNIVAGGFTGASQLINAFTGWRVGLVMLCMNIPLFAFSMRSMGLRFGIRSLIASVLLSVLLDYVKLTPAAEDLWLAALYGGLLSGAGFGLILRGNATTGGTDMLASLINKALPSVPVGTCMTVLDGTIILISAFVFDTTLALYALITAVICNGVIDFILEGPKTAHAYFIITEMPDEISAELMQQLGRGVTMWSCTGMYTGDEKSVLLCAVSRRESLQLRRIIHSVDPAAFMVSSNARGTYGEGFRPLK